MPLFAKEVCSLHLSFRGNLIGNKSSNSCQILRGISTMQNLLQKSSSTDNISAAFLPCVSVIGAVDHNHRLPMNRHFQRLSRPESWLVRHFFLSSFFFFQLYSSVALSRVTFFFLFLLSLQQLGELTGCDTIGLIN